MKETSISDDIAVRFRSQGKTDEHPARLAITIDYGRWLDRFPDQDDIIEEEAQKMAEKIQGYLKKMGTFSIPKKLQFEGEIFMRFDVGENSTLEKAQRGLESILSVIQSEVGRAEAQHREVVRSERMSIISSAIQPFKGRTVDEETIGSIARSVLTTLNNGRRR